MTRGRPPDRSPDPLAEMLPLLRALPAPALLYRLDGTIVAASSALEELIGGPVDGMSNEELGSRLRIRFPTGNILHWDDLCRDLNLERNPAIAVDINDSSGRFHAMVATGALVRSGPEPSGVFVLFSEVTRLVEVSAAAPRQSLSPNRSS